MFVVALAEIKIISAGWLRWDVTVAPVDRQSINIVLEVEPYGCDWDDATSVQDEDLAFIRIVQLERSLEYGK